MARAVVRPPPRYAGSDRERVVSVVPSRDRTDFRRDYSRLIHSPSFRRLTGKAQLFPGSEDDFFRNRLTHSLEVAQIGKSIASIVNSTVDTRAAIDLDLVEFACLAHDVGHPPFGHVGEAALDRCMRELGGFEGNAQTLRIVSCLEKKELIQTGSARRWDPVYKGQDRRVGLNVTYRALASILKYDRLIPTVRGEEEDLAKGYYYFDAPLVGTVRQKVLGAAASRTEQALRTIECSIMDTADDIAYSTFDLEDAFKSGVWTPLGLWYLSQQPEIMEGIAKRIDSKIQEFYRDLDPKKFTVEESSDLMTNFFKLLFKTNQGASEDTEQEMSDLWRSGAASRRLAHDGYLRTELTSGLISRALNELELVVSSVHPALDTIRLKLDKFKEVEVLKGLNYAAVISSAIMKTVEYKGDKIVEELFEILSTPSGSKLLPDDFKYLYDNVPDPSLKKRVICDFIAGMTDRYALEFYDRLVSGRPATIYRPHH